MNTTELLKILSESYGPSGAEEEVLNKIKEVLGGGEPTRLGGLYYKIEGEGGGLKVGVFAHVDEISLMVSKSAGDGFFYLEPAGGVDPKVLFSTKVKIFTRKGVLRGIVGSVAPHLTSKEERGKTQNYDKILIDATMADWKEIKPGDRVLLDVKAQDIGEFISGKALDNRAGCVAAIKAKEYLKKLRHKNDVYLVFSTQEEVGGPGARSVAYQLDLDYAIILDATFAEKVPGYEKIKLKEGPAIGLGPFIDRNLSEFAIEVAKKNGIKHQIEVLPSRTGTDTDAIRTTKIGIKTLLLSIPLMYMHTPVEVVHPDDVESTARLIAHIVAELEG